MKQSPSRFPTTLSWIGLRWKLGSLESTLEIKSKELTLVHLIHAGLFPSDASIPLRITHHHQFLVLFLYNCAIVVSLVRFRVWIVEAPFADASITTAAETEAGNGDALGIKENKSIVSNQFYVSDPVPLLGMTIIGIKVFSLTPLIRFSTEHWTALFPSSPRSFAGFRRIVGFIYSSRFHFVRTPNYPSRESGLPGKLRFNRSDSNLRLHQVPFNLDYLVGEY